MTVAVLDDNYGAQDKYYQRNDNDFHYELFKSTGNGGQKKNKTLSAVKCIHLPTGIKQERDSRSQAANKIEARQAVEKMLDFLANKERKANKDADRTAMVGSGMRGDKIRTYRFQEDIVIDDQTKKKYNLKKIMRGNMDLCWK